MSEGFIYILSNPSIPESLKIGRTSRDPETRAKELSGTSVPTPYRVEYSRKFKDAVSMEKTVHNSLQEYRVSSDREFFNVPLYKAVKVIDDLFIQELEEFCSSLRTENHSLQNKINNLISQAQNKELEDYWDSLDYEWRFIFDLYCNNFYGKEFLRELFDCINYDLQLEFLGIIKEFVQEFTDQFEDDNYILQSSYFDELKWFRDSSIDLSECPDNILDKYCIQIHLCLMNYHDYFNQEIIKKYAKEQKKLKLWKNCIFEIRELNYLNLPRNLEPLQKLKMLEYLIIPKDASNHHVLLEIKNLKKIEIFDITEESFKIIKSLENLEEIVLHFEYSAELEQDVHTIINFFDVALESCKVSSQHKIVKSDSIYNPPISYWDILISDWELALL